MENVHESRHEVTCAWEIDLDDGSESSESKHKPKLSQTYFENDKERMQTTPCTMTPELMLNRKVLDLRRCLSPIFQEEALSILGFDESKKPFNEIYFGSFAGNATVMRWFRKLCNHFRVKGTCSYFYKLHGIGKTDDAFTSELALQSLQQGLRNSNCSFIYHCQGHYMCPVGYEITPESPKSAYSDITNSQDGHKTWILACDTNNEHPTFHSIPWEDIIKDLNGQLPYYYDVRHRYKGIQKLEANNVIVDVNLHCLLIFRKCCSHSSDFTKRIDPNQAIKQ